jgi:hypothetical protein
MLLKQTQRDKAVQTLEKAELLAQKLLVDCSPYAVLAMIFAFACSGCKELLEKAVSLLVP